MNYNYEAQQNYYQYLASGVTAWVLLLPDNIGLKKGDTVTVIEVDSNGEEALLMSSMEIEYYNYLVANSINWSKPKSLRYVDNIGKLHWYKPDFYLIDTQEIIEIKGHWWNNDKIKMQWVIEQNPTAKIKIIMKNDLKEIVGGKSIGADIGL